MILKRQVETDRVFHEREGETERELERASAQLVTPHALSQTPSRRTYSPQIGVFRNRALPRAEVPFNAAFNPFYFPSSNHDSSSSSPHALFATLPFVAGRCPSGPVWVRGTTTGGRPSGRLGKEGTVGERLGLWGSTPPTRMNRREQGRARGYIEHHTGKREAFCKPIMACASRDDARRSCPHWPASRRALGPAAEQRGQGTGRSGTGRRGLGDLATKNGDVSPFVSLEAFFLGSLCSCPSGGFVGWVGALGLGLSGVSGRPCVGTGARGHWYVLVPQWVLLERGRARMVFCKIVMNGTVASKHIYFCCLRYVADGRRRSLWLSRSFRQLARKRLQRLGRCDAV